MRLNGILSGHINHVLRLNFSTFPLRYVSTILALLPEIHSPRETKIEPYLNIHLQPPISTLLHECLY